MTFLSEFRARQPRAGLQNPAVPLTSTALLDWLGLKPGMAGKSVTETSALGMSAVWRAVNLIASTCAGLPLHAFRSDGDARTMLTSGGPADLLANPHPDLTSFELWELGFASCLTWGNAAYRKVRNGAGDVRELWWVNPERIKFGRASDGTKVYTLDGHNDAPLTDREILHIPGFGYDGVCGASPIRLAREGIGLAMAAEEYGARLFGSGSLATGILQTEQRLNQEQADELKTLWRAGGSGLDSAHDIRVMGSGAKFQQLTIPPQDAQFVESRRFQIEEVGRIFGVPLHMIGETAKSTSWGTGIEEQNIAFVIYTLRPWLTRFEQRLSKALQPSPVYARFSVDGLLRGNSAARATFYRSMWELGVFSTNDIRRLEEQSPVDGGDVRYRPLNMGVLGESDAGSTPPDPAGGSVTEGPSTASEAKASEAARYLQQIYLAVGKVITVDEARRIVEQASGITLDSIPSEDIFRDLPPLPHASAAPPAPAPVASSRQGQVLAMVEASASTGITASGVVACTDLATSTVYHALGRLADEGLAVKCGQLWFARGFQPDASEPDSNLEGAAL